MYNRKFFNFAMWWTILSPLVIIGLIASPINSSRTEPGMIALLSGITVFVIVCACWGERHNKASLAVWWMILSPLLVTWALSSDINVNHRQGGKIGTQAGRAVASRKPVHIDYDWTPQGLVPHKDSPTQEGGCIFEGKSVSCSTVGAMTPHVLWSRYETLLRESQRPCKPTAFPLDRWYAEDLMLQNQWETQDRIDGLNNRLDDQQSPK